MKPLEAVPYNNITDKETFAIIALVNKGVLYSSFEEIYKELPFTWEEWARFLDTTTRTLQRWKKSNALLPTLCAERIIEIYQLYKFGVEVFGKEGFKRWLESDIEVLDNKKPVSFLTSSPGINLVRTKLGRIQHGVLA